MGVVSHKIKRFTDLFFLRFLSLTSDAKDKSLVGAVFQDVWRDLGPYALK